MYWPHYALNQVSLPTNVIFVGQPYISTPINHAHNWPCIYNIMCRYIYTGRQQHTVDCEISSLKIFRRRPFPTKIKHAKYFA